MPPKYILGTSGGIFSVVFGICWVEFRISARRYFSWKVWVRPSRDSVAGLGVVKQNPQDNGRVSQEHPAGQTGVCRPVSQNLPVVYFRRATIFSRTPAGCARAPALEIGKKRGKIMQRDKNNTDRFELF